MGQDMRGTDFRQGDFSIWHSDANDSYDLGEWIIKQVLGALQVALDVRQNTDFSWFRTGATVRFILSALQLMVWPSLPW